MLLVITRRLLLLIPILLGVTLFTFLLIQITPGDPVQLMLGVSASPAKVAEMRQSLGLNDPLWVQYTRYIGNALCGNLGHSVRGQTPVLDEILKRLPATLQLALFALCFAMIGGGLLGVWSALTARSSVAAMLRVVSLVGLSLPIFWVALLLLMFFGVHLKWVTVTGGTGIKNVILPALCVALAPAALLARVTRAAILDVVQSDYVRTAYGKGLYRRTIFLRHVLRNALLPIITLAGLLAADLLTGAAFVEVIFARPGLGRFAVDAVFQRDFPQVQGIVLFTAVVFVLLNLLVDLAYAFLDPRLRYP